ncbi:Spy/CpxP family protein refolding chaperone [Ectothiorhodospira haloalkaliphila]|nr:Spy/CpxP family protein refolding chaperone [Ectothiorhodospira haloalkaliphila]
MMKRSNHNRSTALYVGVATAVLMAGLAAPLQADEPVTLAQAGMGQGGMQQPGMAPGQRGIEQLEASLDLDNEQRALWNEFVQHMGPRQTPEDRSQRREAMQETDFLSRMETRVSMAQVRLEEAREARNAARALYRSLDRGQRDILDNSPTAREWTRWQDQDRTRPQPGMGQPGMGQGRGLDQPPGQGRGLDQQPPGQGRGLNQQPPGQGRGLEPPPAGGLDQPGMGR